MRRVLPLVLALFAVAPARAQAPARVRLLVPAYFYPAGEGLKQWQALIASHSPAGGVEIVAIVNINSGDPGKAVNPDYARVIQSASRKGVRLLAYVPTGYGKAPLGTVKEKVGAYFRLYPQLGGVFVDEQSTDGALAAAYYAPLRKHVLSLKRGALVVGNPGTVCAESYLSGGEARAADVVVMYENSDRTTPFSAYSPPAWVAKYPPERFAALVHTCSSLPKALAAARAKRVGYLFVTDLAGPPPPSNNPWGRLPSYWADELRRVAALNR
jgi:hypothetical protein